MTSAPTYFLLPFESFHLPLYLSLSLSFPMSVCFSIDIRNMFILIPRSISFRSDFHCNISLAFDDLSWCMLFSFWCCQRHIVNYASSSAWSEFIRKNLIKIIKNRSNSISFQEISMVNTSYIRILKWSKLHKWIHTLTRHTHTHTITYKLIYTSRFHENLKWKMHIPRKPKLFYTGHVDWCVSQNSEFRSNGSGIRRWVNKIYRWKLAGRIRKIKKEGDERN